MLQIIINNSNSHKGKHAKNHIENKGVDEQTEHKNTQCVELYTELCEHNTNRKMVLFHSLMSGEIKVFRFTSISSTQKKLHRLITYFNFLRWLRIFQCLSHRYNFVFVRYEKSGVILLTIAQNETSIFQTKKNRNGNK